MSGWCLLWSEINALVVNGVAESILNLLAVDFSKGN